MSVEIERIEQPFLPLSSLSQLDLRFRGTLCLFRFAIYTYVKALFNVPALLRGDRSCYDGIEETYMRLLGGLTRRKLDMEFVVHGELPEMCSDDKRMILLGNHPSMHGVFPWMEFAQRNLSERMLGLGKRGHLYDPLMIPPLFGWPLWLTQKVVFLHRNDTAKAMETIHRACSDLFSLGTAAVLYPCAHRPTEKRIALNGTYWAEKYPGEGLEEWQHVCFPRSGGLMELLKGIEDVRDAVRILVVTSAEERVKTVGSPFHFHVKEVLVDELFADDRFVGSGGKVSEEEQRVRGWLLDTWREMEQRIKEWRT